MANQEAFTVGSFNLEFYQALESTRQPEETFCLGNNDSLADVSAVPSQAATEGNASEELESVDKKLIKTLDGSVAKKICTGQVVISLAGLWEIFLSEIKHVLTLYFPKYLRFCWLWKGQIFLIFEYLISVCFDITKLDEHWRGIFNKISKMCYFRGLPRANWQCLGCRYFCSCVNLR